ncbi:unnamed protein product, partial [Meganyctiphanes norvegica]
MAENEALYNAAAAGLLAEAQGGPGSVGDGVIGVVSGGVASCNSGPVSSSSSAFLMDTWAHQLYEQVGRHHHVTATGAERHFRFVNVMGSTHVPALSLPYNTNL